MAFFATADEFLAKFGDLAAAGFFDPIHLNDTKVGFSIKHNYPPDLRYKPAIRQNSQTPDNVAAFWVIYMLGKGVDEAAVPIRIRIATMSLYRIEHWDYDFDDIVGDSPSKDSVEASAATPKPIDLEYSGEYFFNHVNNTFVDRKGRTVSGLDILERVFQDHCKTVHFLWSLRLKATLFAQDKFAGLLAALLSLLIFALKHLFGRTIEADDAATGLYRGYKPEAMKKYNADSLDILGYKASKQVIVVFCVLVIVASVCHWKGGTTNDYWSGVISSEFLSLVHGLLFIWILDALVPWLLFGVINGAIWLRTTILFLKIKGP